MPVPMPGTACVLESPWELTQAHKEPQPSGREMVGKSKPRAPGRRAMARSHLSVPLVRKGMCIRAGPFVQHSLTGPSQQSEGLGYLPLPSVSQISRNACAALKLAQGIHG